MKKFLMFVICSCFAVLPATNLLAGSPAVKAGTPAYSVKTFYAAMAKLNFAAAKKYVIAEEMKKMIDGLEKLTKQIPSLKDDTKKDFQVLADAKIISEKITGNKAEVKYTYLKNKKTKTETLKLQKINNVWLIE